MSDCTFFTTWLASVLDGKSARTLEGYCYATNKLFSFLKENNHPLTIATLKPLHFREFFASVRSGGASLNTIANIDRTLRAIFSRIEREGREDFDLPASWKNPLLTVEKNRPKKIKKNPLSTVQAKDVLKAMPRKGFIAYRNYAEFAFMLMAGARSIEIRHVRLKDLNLERGLVDLRITKGDKPRIVYLPTKLCRIMGTYLHRRSKRISADCELVFPTRDGKAQSRRSIHRSMIRAGARVGISNLGPHRLRHSYVTLSHAKGAPLKFLQEQCGHSSILVTEGYINLSQEQKAELAEKYSGNY